jgi:hypothetical protein
MENWADFASLAVGTDGALTAQWFQRNSPDAGGYDGWYSRSDDGGRTWRTPTRLGHEFVALAPLSQGRTLAVWLESARVRDPNAPRPAKDANAPYSPSMRLKSRLLDAAGVTLQEWIVDPDVCTCCQTALARLPGDQVVVAYRGHLPDETRDNQVARFDGAGWSRPQPLHADGWVIPGCPVNGPAADATGEQLAVAWFTAAQGLARVQVKFSPDGGRSFGPARPVDLGRPIGRVDLITLPDGSAVVSWLEARTEQNQAGLYVRRFFADGAASAPLLVSATSAVRASGFARLAPRPGPGLPVVISWTDATPADPANEKSPAVTRVLTAEFSAAALRRTTTAARAAPRRDPAIVRDGQLVFPEFCATSTAVALRH